MKAQNKQKVDSLFKKSISTYSYKPETPKPTHMKQLSWTIS